MFQDIKIEVKLKPANARVPTGGSESEAAWSTGGARTGARRARRVRRAYARMAFPNRLFELSG